ncbi:MAG: hypothetical protein V3V61_07850 [Gammaproteobacteria bacterium]
MIIERISTFPLTSVPLANFAKPQPTTSKETVSLKNIYKVSAHYTETVNILISNFTSTESLPKNFVHLLCSELEMTIKEVDISTIEVLYGYLHNAFSSNKVCARNSQTLIELGLLEETSYFQHNHQHYSYASIAHIAAAHNAINLLRVLLINYYSCVPTNIDIEGIGRIIKSNINSTTGKEQEAAIECARILIDFKEKNISQKKRSENVEERIQSMVAPQAPKNEHFLNHLVYYSQVISMQLNKLFASKEFAIKKQVYTKIKNRKPTLANIHDHFAYAAISASKENISLGSNALLKCLRNAYHTKASQQRLPNIRLV